MTTTDPHLLDPAHLPTPFSAAEIRDGCRVGRHVRMLVVEGDGKPYIHNITFVTCDAEGAVQEFLDESPDGEPLAPKTQRRSTWLQLQGHASMPSATTVREPDTIDIPVGRFECLRYTRTEEDGVSTFWFALASPGLPLKFEERAPDGTLVYSSTCISDTRG